MRIHVLFGFDSPIQASLANALSEGKPLMVVANTLTNDESFYLKEWWKKTIEAGQGAHALFLDGSDPLYSVDFVCTVCQKHPAVQYEVVPHVPSISSFSRRAMLQLRLRKFIRSVEEARLPNALLKDPYQRGS